MFRHIFRIFLSILTLTLFATAITLQPGAMAVVQPQSASDPLGTDTFLTGTSQSITLAPSEQWNRTNAQAALNDEASRSQSIAPLLVGGIDHAAAGTGTRNMGFGTLRLRGLPTGATVVAAYLYWGTIVQGPQPPFSATANFKGTLVTGSLKGSVAQPCWNSAGVFASYRADVKAQISSTIDGDYKVASLSSHLTDGSDPWSGASANTVLPLSEGATLLVIYSHSSIPTSGQVYLYEDPISYGGVAIVTQTLNPPLPSHTVLKQTRVGADGQVGAGVKPIPSLTDERTYVGPNTSSLTPIRGKIAVNRNFSPDWNGFDGGPMNQLWDTNTDDIVGTVSSGAGSYVTKYVNLGDCVVVVVQALSPH